MGIGDAQRYEIIIPDQPLFKMYHYAAGTSNLSNVWSDAAKTTPLAQPAVADANGQLTFFGDDIYRLVFKDSTDVSISGMDYDNFQITADMCTTFAANQGTVLPSASAANIGHMFLLLDVSNNILGIYVSDGTQYKAMVEFNAAGDQILDEVVTKTHPWYDITHSDWGADTGASAAANATAIQAAISAIPATGGVLYIPCGTFNLNATLTVTNKNIKIRGDGQGKSVLNWTAAGGIDVNLSSIKHTVDIDGVSLHTEVVGGGNALDITWPSTVSDIDNNLNIRNFEVRPTVATEATAYWTKGIVISNAKNGIIDNYHYRGADATRPSGTYGIQMSGDTTTLVVDNSTIYYAEYGIEVSGYTEVIEISKSTIAEVDVDIFFNYASAKSSNTVVDCNMSAFKKGIQTANCVKSTFINNKISKTVTSTDDFIGIDLNTASIDNNVSFNTIFGVGAGGTEDSIVCDTNDNQIMYNRSIDHRYAVHLKSNSNNNIVTFNTKDGGSGAVTVWNEGGVTTANIITDNYPPKSNTTAFTDLDTTPSIKTVFDDQIFAANNSAGTTITAFDDGYSGQIVTVRAGNGNTTIQHGTGANNIYLANLSNFIMSTGDTLTVRLVGTLWYEIARTT